VDELVGLVGRDHALSQARDSLAKGNHLLITGRPGIGKSALLRALYHELKAARPCLYAGDANVKAAVCDLLRQAHEGIGLRLPEARIPPRFRAKARRDGHIAWHHIARNLARMPTKDAMALIADSLKGKRVLVFIDSLEVPPTQAQFYAALLDVAQVAAALCDTNRRSRIQRLLWHFRDRIELKPLPAEACRAIGTRWLEHRPVRFASDAVRDHFLRALAQDSGGVPAALRGMLEAAAAEPEVTRAQVRAFTHEAGVKYLDMTATLVILFAVVLASRYIARGIGNDELYILSGVGIAMFVAVRFFLGRLR